MTDYLAAQQTISAAIDTDIEVITTDLQKIQFANSGQLQLSRPNQLRASRVGGYADVELIFDGTTMSIIGKHLNQYAQVSAPGSLEELIDRLRVGTGAALPAAELMLSRAYEEMTANVIDAKHIGRGVVGGIECEHLAFRTPEVDWQLWVEVGSRPIPRKYVITSKTLAGSTAIHTSGQGLAHGLSSGRQHIRFHAARRREPGRPRGSEGYRRGPLQALLLRLLRGEGDDFHDAQTRSFHHRGCGRNGGASLEWRTDARWVHLDRPRRHR